MNKIRLVPGNYRAITDTCVALFRGATQINYQAVRAGEQFEVPKTVSAAHYFLVYSPDFGDQTPRVEPTDTKRRK